MGILKRTVRGIRDSIPSGYVIGRLSSTDGPAQLIDLKTLNAATVAAIGGGTGGGQSGQIADFGLFFPGKPATSQLIFEMALTRNIILPAALLGGKFGVNTAPTSNYVVTITRNGSSIGTITFLATTGVATISFTAPITLLIGDKLQLTGQTTPDGTMSDLFFSFAATFV